MAANYFRRVGAVRPSHLMFTTGVGAIVDLPNFSVLVRGLEDWNYSVVPQWEEIVEPRLLAAVRALGLRSVKELRPAPWLDGTDREPTGPAGRVGVPIMPFPGWLRCTACDDLAPIDSNVFGFENSKPRKPHEARFFHTVCSRKKSGRKPMAVGARFVLACTAGHLDDFPYAHFVHQGGACPNASHPKLKMDDRGGNLGANVEIKCAPCGARRNMKEVLGPRGADKLPRCRGRRPHLGDFDPKGCGGVELKLLVVGASNQWFAQTLSALAVPRTGASELQAKVEQHWAALEGVPNVAMLPYLRTVVPAFRELERWSDQEVWAAIERHRTGAKGGEEEKGYPDLRTPEWEIFSAGQLPPATDDFTLRRNPDGVPGELKNVYADVIQAERLREVRALVGFTRLDSPDPEDPDLVTRASLSKGAATWVPASEVRGEGIFLRLPEDLLAAWEQRIEYTEVMQEHRDAYARFRKNRYSGRIAGPFDPMHLWPGERYIALHTLSHLLIRTISLECGYSSASLSERIYSGTEADPQRAGILIYTAVPDAEGTLGGLVSLAEPDALTRLTRRALAEAMHCSSDPLCAERLPQDPADFLHGAACHVCLFVSETTCERGNRFLDRRFVVPIDKPDLALFPELP
ncbi:DrmB family protein [Micromonospora sp. DT62]|uniref:DrmB family protein n=1 Tax=Micromonospora sp. DT62 TaxID=3416521 RepID=UPI003CF7CC85